jgi:hypothetical protein
MQKLYAITISVPKDLYDALCERAVVEDRKPTSLARIILKRELLGDVKSIREPLSVVR